ncbi:hypothetical protein LCGC14_1226450, partial [marine sediment metagenome]
MNNPYPVFILEGTGHTVKNQRHNDYKEGWDAREVVTKELYVALKGVNPYLLT